MMIIRSIPNFLTCCNLLCGCIGIVQVFSGSLFNASILIIIAAIFDFLDGFAARLLRASSPIGKDLDSLADVVTFGVLPGLIVFKLINSNVFTSSFGVYLPYIALLIPVFSALRLAKFNNDPRQSDEFIGLPTPANAIFFASFPLILKFDDSFLSLALLDPNLSIGLTIGSCILMVAEIPLISLKFKTYSFKANRFRYLLISSAPILVILISYYSIPAVIILYVVLSFIKNKTERKA